MSIPGVPKDHELLRALRCEIGWTQARMAEEIGLGRPYYSQLESGSKPIKPWILQEAHDLHGAHLPMSFELPELAAPKHTADSEKELRAMPSPTFVHSFSQNLKMLRGGATQRVFAQLLGFENQATYHRYESGRVPRPNVLARIAYRLGLSVEELLAPLSETRRDEIVARLKHGTPDLDKQPWGSRQQARIAVLRENAKLLKRDNVTSVVSAFGLSELSRAELNYALDHFRKAEAGVEVSVQRFYALIIDALRAEIRRRS